MGIFVVGLFGLFVGGMYFLSGLQEDMQMPFGIVLSILIVGTLIFLRIKNKKPLGY